MRNAGLSPVQRESLMDVRIDPHTLERALERGASEAEILDVLQHGTLTPVGEHRFSKARVYRFGKTRLGRYYEEKRVEVIYTVEGKALVTVTVYAFYGKWEEESANPL